MRTPGDIRLEPEVIESIRRYRRRGFSLRLAASSPLILAVLGSLAVLIFTVATDTEAPARALRQGGMVSWIPFFTVTALFLFFVLVIYPEKLPIVSPGESPSFVVFRDALDGVSIAVGLTPPELLVLDVPTANSIPLVHSRKQAVGVTVEALEAGLSRRCGEAMMAHELAHILAGDVFVGSNRRRWILVGLSLVAALLLPFALLALAIGFSVWLYLAMIAWAVPVLIWFRFLAPRVYMHDDLLADSIATKITQDPAGLKDAILLIDDLFKRNEKPFPPMQRYQELFFVHESRPEVEVRASRQDYEDEGSMTEERWEKLAAGLRRKYEKRGAFHAFTIAERVRNLEAIERGHWIEF